MRASDPPPGRDFALLALGQPHVAGGGQSTTTVVAGDILTTYCQKLADSKRHDNARSSEERASSVVWLVPSTRVTIA